MYPKFGYRYTSLSKAIMSRDTKYGSSEHMLKKDYKTHCKKDPCLCTIIPFHRPLPKAFPFVVDPLRAVHRRSRTRTQTLLCAQLFPTQPLCDALNPAVPLSMQAC